MAASLRVRQRPVMVALVRGPRRRRSLGEGRKLGERDPALGVRHAAQVPVLEPVLVAEVELELPSSLAGRGREVVRPRRA